MDRILPIILILGATAEASCDGDGCVRMSILTFICIIVGMLIVGIFLAYIIVTILYYFEQYYEIVFDKRPLGISLVSGLGGFEAHVTGIHGNYKNKDIIIGSRIAYVNGVHMTGLSISDIDEFLREASLPMTIVFEKPTAWLQYYYNHQNDKLRQNLSESSNSEQEENVIEVSGASPQLLTSSDYTGSSNLDTPATDEQREAICKNLALVLMKIQKQSDQNMATFVDRIRSVVYDTNFEFTEEESEEEEKETKLISDEDILENLESRENEINISSVDSPPNLQTEAIQVSLNPV